MSRRARTGLYSRALVVCTCTLALMVTPASGLSLDGADHLNLEQAFAGLWEAIENWLDGIRDTIFETPEQGETHDMGFEIEPNG